MEWDLSQWQYLSAYERKYCQLQIAAYEQIRQLQGDIARISEDYDLDIKDLDRAKDYAFGRGVGQFSFFPDLDMASAWLRLSRGEGSTTDLVFLLHEIFESYLVWQGGLDQKQAHQIAQSRYPWSELINSE